MDLKCGFVLAMPVICAEYCSWARNIVSGLHLLSTVDYSYRNISGLEYFAPIKRLPQIHEVKHKELHVCTKDKFSFID